MGAVGTAAQIVHPIRETSYGEPAGIFGINCGHEPETFIDGESVPRYTPLTSAELEQDNEAYLLTQKQRALERQVRQYRTEAVALHAAGQPIPPELALKVKSAQGRLSEFCKTNGLTERLARTRVTGYNRSLGAAVRKIATHEEKFREFHKNVIISSPHHQNSGKLKEYVQSIGRKQGHLSEADQKLLDALPRRYMWVQVKPEEANVYSLAALTARTGDEYAMFAKDDVKIIVRGRPDAGWHLPKDLSRRVFDERLKWTAHSHPTTVNLRASEEDRQTLAQFTWQQNSLVIDLTGNTKKFTADYFADIFKGWY